MNYQITRIAYLQTCKVVAVLSGIFCAVFFIALVAVLSISHPELLHDPAKIKRLALTAVGLPIVGAAAGALLTGLGAWLYNLIAKYLGGIEVTLDVKRDG